MTVRICFVCLGNICRSPTAEAVMRHHVGSAGLSDQIEIDSAGTASYHVGDPPDERAAAEARRHGIHMPSRGRQFRPADFEAFDLVVAMDSSNVADLLDLARGPAERAKVRLLREFEVTKGADASTPTLPAPDVPDPYYGGPGGFAEVFAIVDSACRGLLDHVSRRNALTPADPA